MSNSVTFFAVAWTTDRDLRYTTCQGDQDLLGTTVQDADLASAHRRALEGEIVAYECVSRGRTLRTCVEPFRDESAHIVGVRGVAVDVTAERALRTSEKIYRLFFEGSPLAMWMVDAGTLAFRAVNDAAVRLYGYPREEFLRMTLRDLRLPEDGPVRKKFPGGAEEFGYVGCFRHRRKDGSLIHVDVHEASGSIDGEPCLIEVLQDVSERLRARETEELFRRAFVESPIGMTLTSIEGRFVKVNAALCEMLEYAEEELLGRHFVEVTHPDDHSIGLDHLKRCLSGESTGARFEKRYVRRSGAVLWVQFCVSLIRDPAGRPLYFVAQMLDITRRRETEQELERCVQQRTRELRDSEEEKSLLLAHTRDFVYRHDARGIFNYLSPAVESITGYAVREWMSHYATFMTDSPFNQRACEYTERTLETGEQSPPYLVEVRHKDGHPILLEVNERAYRENGAVAGIIGVARDVTERERALEAVRASDERFRELAENVRAVFWISEPGSGRFVYVSPAYEPMFGRPVEDVYADPRVWMAAIHPEDRAAVEKTGRRQLDERTDVEFRIVRPDGSVRWMRNSAFPVRDDPGAVRRVAGIAEDVTGRREAEERMLQAADATRRAYEALRRTQSQLVQAEKLASVGMVMAGVAHEINNPLNIILGNLYLLQESCRSETKPDKRKAARMISDAMKAAQNARVVVEEFRHFARDPSGAESGDLRACVEEAIGQAKSLCGRRIRILKKFRALPPVPFYRGQVRRAVQNLLKNAVEAIEGRGTVTIRVFRRGRFAIVEVEDTGHGIPRENLPRVFQPFFTTKEPGRGFGLGLAMCAAVAQNHRGKISVKSRAGQGTRFTLRLPLKA